MKRFLLVWSAALCLLMAALPAHSQQPGPEASQQAPSETDPGLVIRTETQLVLVPFHVIHKNKYVDDLKPDEIQLLEDGVPQKIAIFEGSQGSESGGSASTARTIPIEMVLLLDVSLSVMNRSLLDSFSIKETLLDGLGEDVSVSIYAFAEEVMRFTGPTRDMETLQIALDQSYGFADLGTRLYEAIMQTCEDAAGTGTNATRVMIILSDSFSTTDMMSDKAVMVAKYHGFTLYPVILGHERVVERALASRGGMGGVGGRGNVWGGQRLPGIGRGPGGQQNAQISAGRGRERESLMAEFADMGEATGGRSFDPSTVNNMMVRGILRSVVNQVKAQYVAGYYPLSSGEDKKLHQVRVKLLKKKRKGRLHGGERLVAR